MTASEQGAPADAGARQPNEEEMRAAYEAELARITSAEVILQTAVSLLNLGARRLGLAGGPQQERDLDQVCDAIDAVRGLMPVLERRMPQEVGPLRDALSQLQMAYAREAGAAQQTQNQSQSATDQAGSAPPAGEPQAPAGSGQQDEQHRPGPAESSGRLWVPGN